ncbi:6780_t:CDS:2, partial [Racocetra persica]
MPTTLGYNKLYIYKVQDTQYKEFCNVFAYGLMVIIENSKYPKGVVCEESNNMWKTIKFKPKYEIQNIIASLIDNTISTILNLVPAKNFIAASSHKATEAIVKINSKIEKYQKLYNITTDQEVVKYDSSGYSPLLFKHPDLPEQIHKSIEFGVADSKRRKETIKIRTINHLREELEKKYDKHLSYTT